MNPAAWEEDFGHEVHPVVAQLVPQYRSVMRQLHAAEAGTARHRELAAWADRIAAQGRALLLGAEVDLDERWDQLERLLHSAHETMRDAKDAASKRRAQREYWRALQAFTDLDAFRDGAHVAYPVAAPSATPREVMSIPPPVAARSLPPPVKQTLTHQPLVYMVLPVFVGLILAALVVFAQRREQPLLGWLASTALFAHGLMAVVAAKDWSRNHFASQVQEYWLRRVGGDPLVQHVDLVIEAGRQ